MSAELNFIEVENDSNKPQAEIIPESEIINDPPQKKDGRGRPKGSFKNKPKEEPGTGQPKEEKKAAQPAQNDPLKAMAQSYNTTLPPGFENYKKDPNAVNNPDTGRYVSGILFLMVIDSILPALLIKLMRFLMPEKMKGVKMKNIKLTPAERKELEPLAEEVVKILLGQMSPGSALLLSLSMIYAGKILLYTDGDNE